VKQKSNQKYEIVTPSQGRSKKATKNISVCISSLDPHIEKPCMPAKRSHAAGKPAAEVEDSPNAAASSTDQPPLGIRSRKIRTSVPSSPQGHSRKVRITSNPAFNVKRFIAAGVPSSHQLHFENLFAVKDAFKRIRKPDWPLGKAYCDSDNVHHRMWHRSVVNIFQWRLVEAIIHKLTGGNYIDNRLQWIETSQCFCHIELCCDDTTDEQYLMIKGNCVDIQPLAAEAQANYNPATFGYDPWPVSMLSTLIQTVSSTKNDLAGNFNCDGRVDALLASLRYEARGVPAGVPFEFEDRKFDQYYRCTEDFDVDAFDMPSNKTDQELGLYQDDTQDPSQTSPASSSKPWTPRRD
jgi:hypothetical protein